MPAVKYKYDVAEPVAPDTLSKLLATVKSEFETYPMCEAVAEYAASRVGKRIDKRDVGRLEGEHPGWRFTIHKHDSYFHATELSFWKENEWDKTRMELRISNEGSGSRWFSASEVREHSNNGRYFKYAAERNAERAALLNPDTAKPVGLATAAKLVDEIALLHAELKATIVSYELGDAKYSIRNILKEKTGEEFKNL